MAGYCRLDLAYVAKEDHLRFDFDVITVGVVDGGRRDDTARLRSHGELPRPVRVDLRVIIEYIDR